MSGLQIDLVLIMLVAFAMGICVGRGRVGAIHLVLVIIAGLGSMISMTNIMSALQLEGTFVTNPIRLIGRVLAFGTSAALILVSTRRRAVIKH